MSRNAKQLLNEMLELAREAGAGGNVIPLGDLLLELRQDGKDEVLSIRKAAAH